MSGYVNLEWSNGGNFYPSFSGSRGTAPCNGGRNRHRWRIYLIYYFKLWQNHFHSKSFTNLIITLIFASPCFYGIKSPRQGSAIRSTDRHSHYHFRIVHSFPLIISLKTCGFLFSLCIHIYNRVGFLVIHRLLCVAVRILHILRTRSRLWRLTSFDHIGAENVC